MNALFSAHSLRSLIVVLENKMQNSALNIIKSLSVGIQARFLQVSNGVT